MLLLLAGSKDFLPLLSIFSPSNMWQSLEMIGEATFDNRRRKKEEEERNTVASARNLRVVIDNRLTIRTR